VLLFKEKFEACSTYTYILPRKKGHFCTHFLPTKQNFYLVLAANWENPQALPCCRVVLGFLIVLSFVVVLGFLTVLCFLTAICCSNLHCIFYFNYSLIPNCNVFPKGTEWPDLIGPRVVPVKGLFGRCLSV
jgi:hypothetical protein